MVFLVDTHRLCRGFGGDVAHDVRMIQVSHHFDLILDASQRAAIGIAKRDLLDRAETTRVLVHAIEHFAKAACTMAVSV